MSSHAGSQTLPFFAPSLLALLIRGGQSHPDQTPDGVGTGWMAGLPAAPFINVLLPLQPKFGDHPPRDTGPHWRVGNNNTCSSCPPDRDARRVSPVASRGPSGLG